MSTEPVMEQITEHVWQAENGVFWRVRDNTYETGMDIDRSIQQELADALREERKRSAALERQVARYRAALERYASSEGWIGIDRLYPEDGPQLYFCGPDGNLGYEIAQQALSEGGEEAEG